MSSVEQVIMLMLLIYAVGSTLAYFAVNLLAIISLKDHFRRRHCRGDLAHFTGREPPISVIVPAYNEGKTIVSSLRSILQLDYPGMEVVVVNDGSKDNTLEVLIREYEFEPFPEAQRLKIPCREIRQVYLSRRVENLRLVDKENGGKADAINAAVNITRSPLFCCIDADSILEPTSLLKVVQPIVINRKVMACGGTVRVVNGCDVKQGRVIHQGIPKNPLALFQWIEYVRGFLFGRLGWAKIKALMIISGAFGVFNKELVIRAGGYATDTIGEDMELVLRMYQDSIDNGKSREIDFVPDAVCWTEAPETLKVFGNQRKRWHRGLSESLENNRSLLFAKGSGAVGWLAYPFFALVEWLSPFVELLGYLFTAYLIVGQRVTMPEGVLLLVVAVLLAVFIAVLGLLLDQILFPGSIRVRDVPRLVLYTILECFGYRQLNMYYKLKGACGWLFKSSSSWGEMTRVGFGQK